MSESAQFDRESYTIEILTELATGKEYEGHQIGPEHTLDQIDVIADLIDQGYVSGKALRQGGQPVNIGFPRITPHGREYLRSLIAAREAKRPAAVIARSAKKAVPAVVKWVAGIAAALRAAYLIKRFGLR
jgi:hypothetical protein